jgi:hypothetical protein
MRSNTILVAFMAAAIARADPKIESEVGEFETRVKKAISITYTFS